MSVGSRFALLLFLLLLCLRFYFDDLIPDDATTLAMKRAGIYYYVMAALWTIFGGSLLWLWRQHYVLARMRRELNRLNHIRAALESENLRRQRNANGGHP